MTVKDRRKDITISSSYSFFKHLEYLYPLKIESKPPLPPYPTLLVQLSIRAEVGLILYPDFSVFYVRRPEHDIMFGLNNLISQIVQAHSRRPKGSQSGRGEKARQKISSAGERALLPLVLKNVFVAPFLPVRLTAPGSPRMVPLSRNKITQDWDVLIKSNLNACD